MELSKNVLKFVFGVLLTITGFILSHNIYFSHNPLFGVPFFGQTLLAFSVGAFSVIVLPAIITAVVSWVEVVIAKTAMKAVSEFWERQERKNEEARRKKEEERMKQAAEKEEQAKKANAYGENPVVIDTSAIIDGRLVDVAKTGFLDNVLIVPVEVIEELQLIADSNDSLKRQRGRRGLDILKDLKKVTRVVIREKTETGERSGEGVDRTLIKIAKDLGASIATVDFNLNKVASVSGIKVLNVNELTNAIKTIVLPGESMSIKVVQTGKDATQGVGYLSDGTMVVVEKGSSLVGSEVSVTVSRVIQTPAGKMLFAKKSQAGQ